MNPLAAIRQAKARRALDRIVKPKPEYRARRLSQFDDERKARYWKNVTFDEPYTGPTKLEAFGAIAMSGLLFAAVAILAAAIR